MSKHLGVEYKVRMPQELKDKIAESAKELNRSMNADIVSRLEGSFEHKFGDLENTPTEELMKELAKRLDGFSVVVNK
ncbi:Arc family DNA-binding protein [Acinetobacter schindleri]|uniref:Arc family DNA-binding protein n=1 Tax=Acinetobacter schindleri TaxID=108981 RepID=UPI003F55F839